MSNSLLKTLRRAPLVCYLRNVLEKKRLPTDAAKQGGENWEWLGPPMEAWDTLASLES